MVQVRQAEAIDIPHIRKLYRILDADAESYQPENFRCIDRPEDFLAGIIEDEKADFLLLDLDGKAIGFALVQERETPAISCLVQHRFMYILDFVIAEEYRSKGYGGTLLEAAKEWGRKRDLTRLRLSVFPNNKRGIEFYEGQGLRETMKTMECSLLTRTDPYSGTG